jgi:CubicO group peptidase (beta-lactamase class C family)
MYQRIFQILLLVVVATNAIAQSSKEKKIDDLLRSASASNQFSGVLLASENGKIIYEKAFGMANAEFKVPNTVDTRIGIASITKPMTSIILLRLIEEKKIDPADKLSKYIPDFPNGDKITVQMLAEHRSGIPHRVMPDEMETVRYTSAEMIEKVKAAKLVFEPGTQRLYSSGGYAVLARVLEIASGRPYTELLKAYVFQPAGMDDSMEWDGSAIIARRAQDYLRDERGYSNAPVKDYSFLVGAGSVLSTAADLHKFGMAIIDGRYGATAKSTFLRNEIVSSSGRTNGHRAFMEIRGDKSYGIVLLSNMASGSFEFVQKGVTEILQGKEPSVKTLVVPKFDPGANKNLNEFGGRFKRSDGGEFIFVLSNGHLYSGNIKLYSVKKDCFFDFSFYGDVCFSRDANGTINGVRWAGLTFELLATRQQ